MALIEKLEAIGDAIRAKTGGNEELTLDEMVDEIEGISGGGGNEGLNEDFRTFVENSNPQLSFTTYKSNGTAIRKDLSITNITDIDMPNLNTILARIPINNTIAKKLEIYPLSDISASSVFTGSCNKLELLQSASADYQYNIGLNCSQLAVPNLTLLSNIYVNDGGRIRNVFWPPEVGQIAGRKNGSISKTNNLILTRTDRIVTLNSTNSSYFNSNINVFVPASLLNSYKAATNWSTIADHIYAIEDSENILKGIFNELDHRYDWSEELTLIERLQQQSIINEWQITYNELIMIANDLADNGENSEYYDYRNCLVINKGLPITDNINLFITDTFKYKDANDELIPLSGLLAQRQQFVIQQDGHIGLRTLWGYQKMNTTNTNIGGFGESELYHKLNDSDGSLFTMLPTSLTNDLVEWKIDNDHTALLAPLSEKEIIGTNTYGDSNYDIYDQLALFARFSPTNRAGIDYWWERSPYRSNSDYFCIVDTNGYTNYSPASTTRGVAPAIALGKKGANNG